MCFLRKSSRKRSIMNQNTRIKMKSMKEKLRKERPLPVVCGRKQKKALFLEENASYEKMNPSSFMTSDK